MKKYLVLTQKDDSHEYTIEVEETDKGTEYGLFASNNETWTELARGKELVRIIDTGNGMDVKYIDKQKPSHFEYNVFETLRILMNFRVHVDIDAESRYRIVEDKPIIIV